jgi:Fe-S-cluster-containing hydrogenase component 2
MNRFILADSTKCIGCRTCEVACVVSHQQDQDCGDLPKSLRPVSGW